MYTEIDKNFVYDEQKKTIYVSELVLKFDTSYTLYNPATKGVRTFSFSHSTGPEFDPNTEWHYKCNEDPTITLAVCNDSKRTKAAAGAYLKAKMSI